MSTSSSTSAWSALLLVQCRWNCDHGRKESMLANQPPPLSDISRTSTIKILGVTFSNKLSASDHITNISSASVHKLCTHWKYSGFVACDIALQSVYRSVVVARLLYACNAWWGFTTSADRQRLAGFVSRGVRRGFCSPDRINIDNVVSDMDDKLFYSILKTSITFTSITSSRTLWLRLYTQAEKTNYLTSRQDMGI